ncbi:hypothetical protein K2173_001193 [Erythroxylum novogranatense]|uniref:Uncharacterized protein n=1 Tax=Erythroxylum novogranatense TaxID=1862640 RepID=A0AAV8T316_9ROSI|nr:hypothetical protein K2173_001193 [Erythroxylum novogranatense]
MSSDAPPPPTHDTPRIDPPIGTPQSEPFGPWMQVERRARRPPPSPAGSRRVILPQGSSLRRSSRRDNKLKRSAPLATSRSLLKQQATMSFAANLGASLGSSSQPGPLSLPSPTLVFPLDRAPSTGPASYFPSQPSSSLGPTPSPPPQASSTVGLPPPSLQLPQPTPTGLSSSRPSLAHITISLPSHDALVSPDPSIPIPIPTGLGIRAMDEDPPDPQGPMDTTPSQPLPEATPPLPPDPDSEHWPDGVMLDHPDSTMADQGPVPATLS